MNDGPETLLIVPLHDDDLPPRMRERAMALELAQPDPSPVRQAPRVPRKRASSGSLGGVLAVGLAVATWAFWDALAAVGRQLLQVLS